MAKGKKIRDECEPLAGMELPAAASSTTDGWDVLGVQAPDSTGVH